MAHLTLYLIGGGVAVVVVATVTLVARRRRLSRSSGEAPAPPPSLVRLLTSDDELRDAVHRAAAFERMVAETVFTRARRYEAMVPPAPVTTIAGGADGPVRLPKDASRSA